MKRQRCVEWHNAHNGQAQMCNFMKLCGFGHRNTAPGAGPWCLCASTTDNSLECDITFEYHHTKKCSHLFTHVFSYPYMSLQCNAQL